ncbi:MAG: SusC/RagA family TonB-linked outer membrane protein [Adhaeribacter sp.]
MKRVKLPLLSSFCLLLITCGALQANAQYQAGSAAALADSTGSQDMPQAGAAYHLHYIKQARKDALGAVDQLSEQHLQGQASPAVDALLQGKVAGLRATGYSGAPGSGTLIRIRGNSTLRAGTTPLYIVDGIPVAAARYQHTLTKSADINPLADINPEDIESITILKDAHATALYGARGANGVILIKTTSGTSGKTYLDFTGYTGIQQMPSQLPVLKADDYRAFILAKEQSRGLSEEQVRQNLYPAFYNDASHPDFQRYNNQSDWQDMVLERGTVNAANLKLKGGDALAKYAFNVGYIKQNGVVTDTKFERFNTRFNLDYKVSRKLRFFNSISYTRSDRKMQDEGNSPNTNPLLLATLKAPFLASHRQDPEGKNLSRLDSVDFANRSNPIALTTRVNSVNNTNHILGNIYAEYDFLPGLTGKVSLSADYFRLRESKFSPSVGITQVRNIQRYAAENNNVDLLAQNENTLTYTKKIGGVHAFTGMAGNALVYLDRQLKSARSINSPSDEFSSISSTSAANIDSAGSSASNYVLASYFTSLHYGYADKYLLGFNLRADGSTRFGDNNRWAWFPAVAAAWRLSAEPFLAGSRLSELKLRTSYGRSGNHEIGNYASKSAIVAANSFNFPGVRLGILGDPNLKWETTTQLDLGLDAALGRLSFSLDLYTKNTRDLLNFIYTPGVSGFHHYLTNSGSVRNRGVEFGAEGRILTGALSWTTNFNVAYNQNEVTALPGGESQVDDYGSFQSITQVGHAIGNFYGYKALGVYASDADVKVTNAYGAPFKGGDIIFQDVNFDGVIDERDKKVIGNSSPDVFGGFGNTFAFRNFDLNLFFDFSYGNQVYNAQRAQLEAMSGYDNQSTAIQGRWQKAGDQTAMPRMLHGDAVGNTRFSSRWIEDASYTRLKALTLGYTVPEGSARFRVLQGARIYATAQNLLTLTGYKGYDPEVANVSLGHLYGVDYGSVPQLRSFILGVRLAL